MSGAPMNWDGFWHARARVSHTQDMVQLGFDDLTRRETAPVRWTPWQRAVDRALHLPRNASTEALAAFLLIAGTSPSGTVTVVEP